MLYNLSEDEAFFYKRGEYKLTHKNIKYVNDSISEMHQEDLFTILLAENFTEVEKGVNVVVHLRSDDGKVYHILYGVLLKNGHRELTAGHRQFVTENSIYRKAR